jgi:prepilin-type N-terminal cleavage/methylation domain-containing protein
MRRLRRGRKGFTLLEVLLALTILAMAGTIVYGFLATALISWTTGVDRGRTMQVAGIAADRLAQQLKSTVPASVLKSRLRVAAFDGGEDSLRFVTLLPTGLRSLRQVSYSIEEGEEGAELAYREYPWPDKNFFEEQEIIGMEVTLRARESEADKTEEGDEWSPGAKELPREVEVRLVAAGRGDERERSVTVAVPLLAHPVR